MDKLVGITVKKKEDFSEWYSQVVLKAELADYSLAKGFIVLRPDGYAIWEMIKEYLDEKIQELGHRNAYFPTLIPENLLSKEAEHFTGFIPEVFWVTKSGDNELHEKLAIRPTSETIAYSSYSKWIKSWRDLPLLLNFWNSVLRAEIKGTKPFIRTSEFLWQEGHTVHETEEEATKEVLVMLEVYKELMQNCLAVPVQTGYKSDKEKFVGAKYTYTLESLMPDGKALQMGTSHHLGQNFSKPFEIKYLGKDKKEHTAWQTSWGVSWRLIGALIMTHGDDKGLVLPPRIAPTQVVIVPIYYNDEDRKIVNEKVSKIKDELKNKKIRVEYDNRDNYTPGWKFNEWELKGIPIRIEIGPRDIQKNEVTVVRRDTREKISIKDETISDEIVNTLNSIQDNLLSKAKERNMLMTKEVLEYNELKSLINSNFGFVKTYWCGGNECEEKIKNETGADIRLIAKFDEKTNGKCIICEKEALCRWVYFSKAY